jgi:hypothetical protein
LSRLTGSASKRKHLEQRKIGFASEARPQPSLMPCHLSLQKKAFGAKKNRLRQRGSTSTLFDAVSSQPPKESILSKEDCGSEARFDL